MEGIINPLAVREPFRCRICGNEWVGYDLDEETQVQCPRCQSSDVAPLRS